MEVNGWRLFQHLLFRDQYDKLLKQAAHIKAQHPGDYQSHKTVKLLAKISDLILDEIPSDPRHAKFNLGNTLGTDYRHWKRAKFGRFRFFFRYRIRQKTGGTEEKVIVYVWVNDEETMRKEGDKNDPYALFAKGLHLGKPPDSFDALLKQSIEFESPESVQEGNQDD